MTFSRPYEDPGRVKSSTGKHEHVDAPWAVIVKTDATAQTLRFKDRASAVRYVTNAKKENA
jgi:hypothetical protein